MRHKLLQNFALKLLNNGGRLFIISAINIFVVVFVVLQDLSIVSLVLSDQLLQLRLFLSLLSEFFGCLLSVYDEALYWAIDLFHFSN